MDVEEDALNHFVALCGVNVVVQLEHPCWAKEWYFNQGGEKKTCNQREVVPFCMGAYVNTWRGGVVGWSLEGEGHIDIFQATWRVRVEMSGYWGGSH